MALLDELFFILMGIFRVGTVGGKGWVVHSLQEAFFVSLGLWLMPGVYGLWSCFISLFERSSTTDVCDLLFHWTLGGG